MQCRSYSIFFGHALLSNNADFTAKLSCLEERNCLQLKDKHASSKCCPRHNKVHSQISNKYPHTTYARS